MKRLFFVLALVALATCVAPAIAQTGPGGYLPTLTGNETVNLSYGGQRYFTTTQAIANLGGGGGGGGGVTNLGGATGAIALGANLSISGNTLNAAGGGGGSAVTPTAFPAAVGGVITLAFPSSGNVWYAGVISANTTFAISGGSNALMQEMTIEIHEDGTGNHTITLPTSASTPAVLWDGGQPTPTTTAGAVNIYRINPTITSGVFAGRA